MGIELLAMFKNSKLTEVSSGVKKKRVTVQEDASTRGRNMLDVFRRRVSVEIRTKMVTRVR